MHLLDPPSTARSTDDLTAGWLGSLQELDGFGTGFSSDMQNKTDFSCGTTWTIAGTSR